MAFVWVNRARNIASDDLTGASLIWAWSAAGLALLGAVVLAATAVTGRLSRVAAAVLVIHVGWWAVRAVQIAAADHSLAFIVVHVVLALISIGLGLFALRDLRARRGEGLGPDEGRGVSSPAWDSPSPSSKRPLDAEEWSPST